MMPGRPHGHLRSLHPRRDLDTAEGILVALRRCRIETAFQELLATANRHRVPLFTLASALVDVACEQGSIPHEAVGPAHAAAQQEWKKLLDRADRAPRRQ